MDGARYIRPGTRYKVNTHGRERASGGSVVEEHYVSVRDRIAGFNQTINDSLNESFNQSSSVFSKDYSTLSLQRNPKPLMNSTHTPSDMESNDETSKHAAAYKYVEESQDEINETLNSSSSEASGRHVIADESGVIGDHVMMGDHPFVQRAKQNLWGAGKSGEIRNFGKQENSSRETILQNSEVPEPKSRNADHLISQKNKSLKSSSSSSSSNSDKEVKLEESNEGLELCTSKIRIKIKDEDEPSIYRTTVQRSEMQSCQSNFEDGVTTTDELDDEILEHTVYLYKGQYNTWRTGPDMTTNRCYTHSNCTADHDEFIKMEKAWIKKNKWWEYTKYGWTQSGLFEVRHWSIIEPGERIKLIISGTFNSKWKSNVVAGMYEAYENEYGTYYKRVTLARGRPDIANYPAGEEDPNYIPRRPQYTFKTELVKNVEHFDTINHTSPEMNSFVNLILKQDDIDVGKLNTSLSSIVTEKGNAPAGIYLYKHENKWRIGKKFNERNCWVFTNQENLDCMITATWYEAGKSEKSTNPSNTIDINVTQPINQDDFVYISCGLLTIMKGQNISGAYRKVPGVENVYQYVKSIYLNGKFQTEFKQQNLVGWYDQSNPAQYVKRDEVEHFYIYRREGRWQIGPDPHSKLCWLFSTRTEKSCDEYIRWFEPVKDKWTRNRTVMLAPVK